MCYSITLRYYFCKLFDTFLMELIDYSLWKHFYPAYFAKRTFCSYTTIHCSVFTKIVFISFSVLHYTYYNYLPYIARMLSAHCHCSHTHFLCYHIWAWIIIYKINLKTNLAFKWPEHLMPMVFTEEKKRGKIEVKCPKIRINFQNPSEIFNFTLNSFLAKFDFWHIYPLARFNFWHKHSHNAHWA